MLGSREIITTLSGETLEGVCGRRVSVESSLWPLLWCLVMDVLLWELNNDVQYIVGYDDDTATLINGKFLQIVKISLYPLYDNAEALQFYLAIHLLFVT
jgi:hypothetical protein